MSTTIKLELYTQTEDVKYEGRLLGLITNKEFNALLNDKTVQNKIYTKETIPLTDIMGLKSIEDMRLVITVRSRDDKDIPMKTLFVSDLLSMAAHEYKGKADGKRSEVILNTNSDDCIFLKEVKKA